MSREPERRSLQMAQLRVQPKSENAGPIIEGHAALFNEWSQEMGGIFTFKERVMPGAFKETIQNDDIRALFNHDPNKVLGRNRAGTLELVETQKGLLVRIYPPETQWARDLIVSISRGDILQMSFGFYVEDDSWIQECDITMRELRRVKLVDVSPVTYPAYDQTDVGVRALEHFTRQNELDRQNELEKIQKLQTLKKWEELFS